MLQRATTIFSRFVGPAALTAAGMIGAGAVATRLLAGAWFGFELLWVTLIVIPMVIFTLDSASRVGVTSNGRGLIDMIRTDIGAWLAWLVFLPMALVNVVVNMSQMSAMVEGAYGVLVVGGAVSVLAADLTLGDWTRTIVGFVAVLGGVAVIFGPTLRVLTGALVAERRERIRADERAVISSHLHDSVLQTLTLIQKRSLDPSEVQARWRDVQAAFVDDPGEAVKRADGLVGEVVESVTRTLTSRADELRGRWEGSGEADTERLRLALREYRSVLERLLDLTSAGAGARSSDPGTR